MLKKHYIKTKINAFLTIGTLKKTLYHEQHYTKKLNPEIKKLKQRNIIIKKETSQKTCYIERKKCYIKN